MKLNNSKESILLYQIKIFQNKFGSSAQSFYLCSIKSHKNFSKMGLQSTLQKISYHPKKGLESEVFHLHNYWNIHNFLISNVEFINDQSKEFEVSRHDLKNILYYLKSYTTPNGYLLKPEKIPSCRKEEFINLDEEINLIEKLLLSTKDKNFTFYYSYCN